jgi:predicted esterase YcpF (UPF0227 family)
MKVAYFHGLESDPYTEKNDILRKYFDYVYDPPMNYQSNINYDKIISEIKEKKIDLLIGSSMGGWISYCISTKTNIPTLLFNPALHNRSIHVNISPDPKGGKKVTNTIILGLNDQVIKPFQTVQWLQIMGNGNNVFHYENMAHRTPVTVFENWIKKYK